MAWKVPIYNLSTKTTVANNMVSFNGASVTQAVLGWTLAGPTNLTQLFGPGLSPRAQIILPGAEWTTEVQQRWSTYQAPTYTGAIKPAIVADIQHIVCPTQRYKSSKNQDARY